MPLRLRGQHQLAIATVTAIALSLVGGTAIAVTMVTRPAFVFGKPMSEAGNGSISAHMGNPGHPVQTTLEGAGRLDGFRVLTLRNTPGAALRSITYVPPVIPDGQRVTSSRGAVSLEYLIDGTELQINEQLDPNPSAPLQIDQKVAPDSPMALCTRVEPIGAGQYVVVRCPDGATIKQVFWKTLDGVDIALIAVPQGRSDKPPPSAVLSMSLVETVIDHLQ